MKDIEKLIQKLLKTSPELATKLSYLSGRIESPSKLYATIGSELFKKNHLDWALKFFDKANSIQEDYLSLYNSGCIYYSLKKYKDAILNLEKSKEKNSKFFMSHLVAGLAYSMLGNSKAAESNFISVLKANPGNETALTALSILYYNRGEFDNSMKLIDSFSQKGGKNKNLSKLKTDILYETGKLKELVQEIKERKKTESGYKIYDEYIKSVQVRVFTDRYGTMEQKIERLETEEENKKNLISLSLCHLFSGNTDSALDYLMQAKEI